MFAKLLAYAAIGIGAVAVFMGMDCIATGVDLLFLTRELDSADAILAPEKTHDEIPTVGEKSRPIIVPTQEK